MRQLHNYRRTAAAATLGVILAASLSGCATLGGSGPAICHGDDGTMVPLSDARCPEEVRRALRNDEGPPESVDQSMNDDAYNMAHGLAPGDRGAH